MEGTMTDVNRNPLVSLVPEFENFEPPEFSGADWAAGLDSITDQTPVVVPPVVDNVDNEVDELVKVAENIGAESVSKDLIGELNTMVDENPVLTPTSPTEKKLASPINANKVGLNTTMDMDPSQLTPPPDQDRSQSRSSNSLNEDFEDTITEQSPAVLLAEDHDHSDLKSPVVSDSSEHDHLTSPEPHTKDSVDDDGDDFVDKSPVTSDSPAGDGQIINSEGEFGDEEGAKDMVVLDNAPVHDQDQNQNPLAQSESTHPTSPEKEEFISPEGLLNATSADDWDALLNHGNSNANKKPLTKWERDSLYVNFDPLISAQRVANRASIIFKVPAPPKPKIQNRPVSNQPQEPKLYADKIRRITELKENVKVLTDEYESQRKENLKILSKEEMDINKLVDEYIKANSVFEKMKNEKEEIIQDRDEALADQRNMECGFAEMLMTYENIKTCQRNIEDNCEGLQEREAMLMQAIEKRDERDEAAHRHFEDVVEKIRLEFESKLKEREAENVRLKANFRITELKISNLEGEIAQIDRENEKLRSLCDDLLKK